MKAWNYLSGWTNFTLPNNIQKRLYKFVLRKAIGQFLQNELDLENFDIALINGNLELRELDLNLEFINKLLADTPFILERGSVASINASIPWSKLLSGDISLKIVGLNLSLRPIKNKPRDTSVHIEEQLMSSSLHFADDFLKTEISEELLQESMPDESMEGLEILTKVIDKMMSRVKVDILDTVVSIKHKENQLDVSIPRISYFDETPEFNATVEHENLMESSILTNETIKIITISSPKIWLRSTSLYSMTNQSETIINEDLSQTEFFDTFEGGSELFQMSGSVTPKAIMKKPYESLLFTTMNEKNWIRMKLRPSMDNLSIKQIDFLITHMRFVITPQQVAFFLDLLDEMTSPPATTTVTTTPTTPNTPTLRADNKIKLQISKIEIYVLGDDEPILNWDTVDRNHLLLAVKQVNFKHQINNSLELSDLRIANISLDEWIVKPENATNLNRYHRYNPILMFDNKIKSDYSDQDQFPSYMPTNEKPDQSDPIRFKIEKKSSQFIQEQDTSIDIPSFKLLIDPTVLNRLDNYIQAVLLYNQRKVESSVIKEEPKPSVLSDLQLVDNIKKSKVKLKCAFIRIILFVPDMSQISTREEFNDRFHSSQLSVDVKKLVVTWSSHLDSDIKDVQLQSNKINIELSQVNVFMQLKKDKYVKSWFTAKTVKENKHNLYTELTPTIEITIQDQHASTFNSNNNNNNRTAYFGSGSDIPQNLFNFLDRNESFNSEQKLRIPMDEQSESALIFKQRTIETSLFVVNCHFPQADLRLTKQIWDKIQIIQNDILLWQPQFLLKQPSTPTTSPSLNFLTNDSNSIMSQSHERLLFISPIQTNDQPVQQKTLFSIIAVMSNGVWDLNTSENHTYRLQFNEFKYFAAIKHLGQNENMTTLDIEELELFDISNPKSQILLLYKTIPKNIHPKCNTAMVSLFSRLTNFPESNKINKVTSVVVCNICWKATFNIDFINEIVEFQKVPEEMVFIDPPTQYIKVFAHVLETSIDYEPVYSPTRAVIVLDGIEVITNILAGQPMIQVKTFLQSIDLLLIDDKQELDLETAHQLLEGKTSDAKKFWSTIGFSNTLSVQNIELGVKIKLDEHVSAPQTEVTLVSTDICLDANADSFQTFLNLITFATNNGDQTIPNGPPPAPPKVKKTMPKKKTKENMLASIDESAFKITPRQISPPTLIDIPEMEEFSFVEEFYHKTDDYKKPPTKPRRNKHRKASEDIIRILLPEEEITSDQSPQGPLKLQVIEDFFGVEKKVTVPRSVVDVTKAVLSLRVSNVNIVWKLYNGYEWDYIRADMAAREIKEKQQMAGEQQTGFGEDLDQVGGNISYKKKRRNRTSGDAYIEIKLDSISVDFDLMPPKHDTAFYFHLLIKDVEIIDNIKTSAWKKFLGYMKSSKEQREVDSCMVDVELISLKPIQDDPQQEFRLKVKMLPVRLYVDQDALAFLQKYFLFNTSYLRSTDAANASIPKQVDEESEESDEEEEDSIAKSSGVFFQHVDIHPIILKVDYKPKVFNLGNFREGQIIELMNIFRLDGSEVCLNQVKLTGINGIDNLLDKLGQEWLPHILNTQKINMVSGVSPVRSIVNLGTGVADLVLLPIQQYRKDGRIIKGIQKGTSSFARATAIEAIKLSSRVASGTQVILEHADGFFSPTESPTNTSSSSHPQQLQDQHFVYTDMNGLDITTSDDDIFGSPTSTNSFDQGGDSNTNQSYQNLGKNIGAQTIFAVPTEIQTNDDDYYYGQPSSSSGKGAKSVIRAVPVAVIKPMIGLTGAFQSILTGLRKSIDPVMRLQSEDKYKKPK